MEIDDELKRRLNGMRVRVALTPNGPFLERVECPECGEYHVVDEPGEKQQLYLYCDNKGIRVKFPGSLSQQLKELSRRLFSPESAPQNDTKQPFEIERLNVEPGRQEVRIKFKS